MRQRTERPAWLRSTVSFSPQLHGSRYKVFIKGIAYSGTAEPRDAHQGSVAPPSMPSDEPVM